MVYGLLKSIFSLASGILVLIASILLAKPLGSLIFNTGIGSSLTNALSNFLISINETAFNTPIPITNQEEAIATVLTSLQIPSFLNGILSKLVLSLITIDTEAALGFLLGKALCQYILYFLSGLVIFVVLKIIFIILGKLTKNINQIPIIGLVNRIGGELSNNFIHKIIQMYL
ncbi:MAG: hypothetical protein SOW55_05465 [Bacilli bacterium]|nr:hypothetical protein [Bacilli bacterium]